MKHMARGTFKTISARLNVPMSDVRSAFGRTAADIAREYLNDVIDKLPSEYRGTARSRVGGLWRAVVGPVYKAVARLVKDKAAQGTLAIQGGKFNITKAEVDQTIDRSALVDRVNKVLAEEYKIPATLASI